MGGASCIGRTRATDEEIGLRVRFWGTRGSIPVPGERALRYGGNTSCVEVVASDGTRILIDAGSGAYALGQECGAGAAPRGHLLLSHIHWDHIQGLPFCDPLFAPDAAWQIHLPTSPPAASRARSTRSNATSRG